MFSSPVPGSCSVKEQGCLEELMTNDQYRRCDLQMGDRKQSLDSSKVVGRKLVCDQKWRRLVSGKCEEEEGSVVGRCGSG